MDPFWQHCLHAFREEVDEVFFDAFIKPTSFRVEDNTFIICAPNVKIERWIKRSLEKKIQRLGKDYFTHNMPIKLSYRVCPQENTSPGEPPQKNGITTRKKHTTQSSG